MKEKLSILTLSLSSGGTERFIVNILPKLIEDFEVHLFLLFNDFHYQVPEGVKVTCYSDKAYLSRSNKLTSFIQIASSYYKFLKKNNITTSISFLPLPNFVNGMMNTLLPKVKCILSERNFPTNMYKKNKAYGFFIPFFYNKADALFSNSIYINEDLQDNFKVNIPMDVVYNPVRQSPKMVRNNDDIFHVMNVGSFQPYRKNQMLLINAGKILKNVVPFHMHFYGDGELRPEILDKVQNFKMQSLTTFHGKVSNIFEKYASSDIFVLSSNSEGFPNALLEAMSIGLPVISTNCMSGPLEMLNNNEQVDIPQYEFVIAKYGILININDDIALAKAIKFLYQNPDVYKSMSEKGFDRAQHYNLDRIYTNFYNKLLKEN